MSTKPLALMLRQGTKIIVIAALYYLTARLDFLMSLSPGNITILWPSSGITLAAVVIWGWPMGCC